MKELKEYCVDVGVMSALRLYLWYGLDPGSFGQAILLGDKDLAYSRAHSLLKTHVDKPIEDMFELVWVHPDRMPKVCLGQTNVQRWIDCKGMKGSNPSLSVEVTLMRADQWWA